MEHKLTKFRKITYPGIKENRYLISENGEVFSIFSNKILKPISDKDGYLRITISGMKCIIARLVAYQYCGNNDLTLVVDHKDGNKTNNHYTNLEWVTIKENTNRAENMGLRNVRGSANGNSRYNEEFIHDICRLLENGLSVIEVCRILKSHIPFNLRGNENNTFYQFIYKLKNRLIWPDVTSQYKYDNVNRKSQKLFKPHSESRFTEQQIHDICKSLSIGKNIETILNEFNILPSDNEYKRYRDAIYEIRRGDSWKYISNQYILPKTTTREKNFIINKEDFFAMVDKGYSREDIRKAYGIEKASDNPKLYRIINRRFFTYTNTKKLHDTANILMDIDNIECMREAAW